MVLISNKIVILRLKYESMRNKKMVFDIKEQNCEINTTSNQPRYYV